MRVTAATWFSQQAFGATAEPAPSNWSIVDHWRKRIASGQLSSAQMRAAEDIIARELRGVEAR